MAKNKKIELPEGFTIDPGQMTSNQMIDVSAVLNCDFQRAAKSLTSDDRLIDDDGNNVVKAKVVRAMIWASLRGEYPDLTIEEAGDIPLSVMVEATSGLGE